MLHMTPTAKSQQNKSKHRKQSQRKKKRAVRKKREERDKRKNWGIERRKSGRKRKEGGGRKRRKGKGGRKETREEWEEDRRWRRAESEEPRKVKDLIQEKQMADLEGEGRLSAGTHLNKIQLPTGSRLEPYPSSTFRFPQSMPQSVIGHPWNTRIIMNKHQRPTYWTLLTAPEATNAKYTGCTKNCFMGWVVKHGPGPLLLL